MRRASSLAPYRPRLVTLLTVVGMGLTLPECTCTVRVAAPSSASEHKPESAPAAPPATPSPQQASPTSGDAPTVASILDAARDPYRHNPVSWQFRNLAYLNGAPGADPAVSVSMTTTRDRADVAGTGMLFTMVVQVDFGPGAAQPGEPPPAPSFRRHLALLTPQGLYVGPANEALGDLEADATALVASLTHEDPTWPLPGLTSCEHSVSNLDLGFGRTRGIVTHCPSIGSAYGQAEVTTAWVDRVGFVYREIDPQQDDVDPSVHRDFLQPSDLTELAPPPVEGEPFQRFAP